MIKTINVSIAFNEEELKTSISNALFKEFQTGNKKKLMDMSCYELSSHLPEIIAKEIMECSDDIIETK